MQAVLNQSNCPTILSKGVGISGPEIEEMHDLEDNESLVYMTVKQDFNGTLSRSSNGKIIEGDINLMVYASGENGDIEAVKQARKRVALGWNNDGVFGQPCIAPFFIAGFCFLRWEPLGKEFLEEAILVGKNWLKQQIIQFELIKE